LTVFDNDEVVQGYVKTGTARLLQGDALIRDDVQRAWREAAKIGDVDLLLFTVGELSPHIILRSYRLTLVDQAALPNFIR
jgi:hypothetical protein